MEFDLEAFTRAYMDCALWSSTGDDDEPLDDVHGIEDLAPETAASMREDCADFVKANAADLAEFGDRMRGGRWSVEEHAGCDFWLTRNGHGAGFWDRGLGELGERLSAAAKVYGSVDLYVGDDGLVYA